MEAIFSAVTEVDIVNIGIYLKKRIIFNSKSTVVYLLSACVFT